MNLPEASMLIGLMKVKYNTSWGPIAKHMDLILNAAGIPGQKGCSMSDAWNAAQLAQSMTELDMELYQKYGRWL